MQPNTSPPLDLDTLRELAGHLPFEFEGLPSFELESERVSGPDYQRLWAETLRSGFVGGGLGVYLHFPYCTTKCRYCHCYSTAEPDRSKDEAYLDRLYREIDLWRETFAGTKLTNAYFGGGTPTVMGAEHLDRLLTHVKDAFEFTPAAQLNVEGTPRTLTKDMAAVLGEHGVHRVSMGVQSMEAKVLRRAHRAWQKDGLVETARRNLREAGVPIVNGDLIAGLDGQGVEGFLRDCASACEMDFDTIHIYFFDPDGTPFRQEGGEMDAGWKERRDEMIARSHDVFAEYGYRAGFGETVFAKRPFDEILNRYDYERYFLHGSVLGLGASAYGHVFPGHTYKQESLGSWAAHLDRGELPPVNLNRGDRDHAMREFLVFNLKSGFPAERFSDLFGVDAREAFPEPFDMLRAEGLLREDAGVLEARGENQRDILAISLAFWPEEQRQRIPDELW